MRILVLADIHANWPALAAIEESFDVCLVIGDLVDYGTDPAPCVDWVRRHATYVVRGNHDHAVAQRVPARGGRGLRNLAAATRPVQWQALDGAQMKFLSRLPVTQTVQLGEYTFLLVHATPRDPLDEYLLQDEEAWRQRLFGVEADFVCVGHSHIQFDLQVNGTRVLNPGSDGQPRDGDPRCAYAVIENGQVELCRVPYDIDATLRQMATTGVPDWVVRMSETLLKSGGRVVSDIYADETSREGDSTQDEA